MTIIIPEMTPQQEVEAFIRTHQIESERRKALGDRIYLVSANWFQEWCRYTGYTSDPVTHKLVPLENQENRGPRPGPIDNSDIVDFDAEQRDLTPEEFLAAAPIKAGLRDKSDYWALHEATYKLLKGWYKVTGPDISRECLPVGYAKRLEFNAGEQWHIKAIDEHSGRSVVVPTIGLSTGAALKKAACKALDIDESEYILMSYQLQRGPESLEKNLKKTLVSVLVVDRQAVLLRRRDHPTEAATAQAARKKSAAALAAIPLPAAATPAVAISIDPAPRPALTLLTTPKRSGSLSPRLRSGTSPTFLSSSPLSRSFGRAPNWAEDATVQASGRRPGLAGLSNLGNTCFMNSSLQCLTHTVPFMRTFLSGDFNIDMNRDNPLGLGGKLATAFGTLMSQLWRGNVAYVSPKHFKWQLGKFAPQFGGYAQQDSQELLAFLLDGLHEDLNRIAVKPYREEKDSNGRPDAEVAAEAWENYRARNDSVVVDHFQGLLKSTLRCPDCSLESVKFDPFMYLSLPLPTPKTRTFYLTVVDTAGTRAPLAVAVEVAKNASIGELLASVATLCGEGGGTADEVAARWLLTQYSQSSTDKMLLYSDTKAPVSSIQSPRQISFFNSKPAQLIVFRYPDPAAGPASGYRHMVIFHRMKQNFIAPATVLYVPQAASAAAAIAAAAGVKTGNNTSSDGNIATVAEEELVVIEHPGKSSSHSLPFNLAINAALETVLAPFVRPSVEEESGARRVADGDGDVVLEEGPAGKKLKEASPDDLIGLNIGSVSAIAPPYIPTAASGIALGMPVLEDTQQQQQQQQLEQLPHLLPTEDGMEDNRGGTAAGTGTGTDAMEGTAGGTMEGTAGVDTTTAMDTSMDLDDLDDLVQPDTPVHSIDGTPSSSDAELPALEDVDVDVGLGLGGAGPSMTDLADMSDVVLQQQDVVLQKSGSLDGGSEAMAVDGTSHQAQLLQEAQQASAMEDASATTTTAVTTTTTAALEPTHPYVLALSSIAGAPKYVYSSPVPISPLQGSEPIYLCAEWQESAAATLDRSLWDLPEQHESVQLARAAAAQGPPRVTLRDCVEAFCQREQLDESDSWYCSTCKSHVRAEKKLDLWHLPEVLVVHLKRFSYSRYSRDKLDTEVEFPLEGLDLCQYVPTIEGGAVPVTGTGIESAKNSGGAADSSDAGAGGASAGGGGTAAAAAPVYDLFAVSNHFGGLGGGHYTAFCRLPSTNTWYTFDDSSVHEMDASSVKTSAAYVLFYRRRGAPENDVGEVIEAAVKKAAEEESVAADAGGVGGLTLDVVEGSTPTLGPFFARRGGSGPMLEQVGEGAGEGEAEDGVSDKQGKGFDSILGQGEDIILGGDTTLGQGESEDIILGGLEMDNNVEAEEKEQGEEKDIRGENKGTTLTAHAVLALDSADEDEDLIMGAPS